MRLPFRLTAIAGQRSRAGKLGIFLLDSLPTSGISAISLATVQSARISISSVSLPLNEIGTVAALRLSNAGTYVIGGELQLFNFDTRIQVEVACGLRDSSGDAAGLPYSDVRFLGPQSAITIPLNGFYVATATSTELQLHTSLMEVARKSAARRHAHCDTGSTVSDNSSLTPGNSHKRGPSPPARFRSRSTREGGNSYPQRISARVNTDPAYRRGGGTYREMG